jgi:adenosine 3'-phospho 5'-phosphosulfate transporter B3
MPEPIVETLSDLLSSPSAASSLSQVCQVILSFAVFPKPMSWKYIVGGSLVALALYWLQRTGKKPPTVEVVEHKERHQCSTQAANGSASSHH